MGGQQSKISEGRVAGEKLIIERLQALQMKDKIADNGEYVHIEGNEKRRQYVSESPGISVSTIKQWEHELLQDPKNR
jgi:hypothetical protein